ncbi:MAG TPA: signal peptidase I [Candidatus Nanoarchaeia archaeon]|nr:signal peptidase I [Candidatus Nanoarchaeia archaeon]
MDKWGKIKAGSKKVWLFIWKGDSFWSWLVNAIIAFIAIRFLVYPLLGLILGTGLPIVAVVSESMEHGLHNQRICQQTIEEFRDSFTNYWDVCGEWYEDIGITQEQFSAFPFKNGFNKGDVIILWRANVNNIQVGDVLVFKSIQTQPIIHRVVKILEEENEIFYQTKGDHNSESISGTYGETKISQGRILGQGVFRIPYLGWIKILFVDAVRPLGIVIDS